VADQDKAVPYRAITGRKPRHAFSIGLEPIRAKWAKTRVTLGDQRPVSASARVPAYANCLRGPS
jgi:hypothetical protein